MEIISKKKNDTLTDSVTAINVIHYESQWRVEGKLRGRWEDGKKKRHHISLQQKSIFIRFNDFTYVLAAYYPS